jgi:glycerophosphoryl diester phosphodiesterase
VNSSHNSYIPCNQNLDIASLESIKNVLLMGARCIELDIHEKNNEPVVAHGRFKILTTSYLSLEDCIDVVNKYGFLTSDPLVLFIEVHATNKKVLKKINNIIKSKLGNRLLSNEYKINNINKKYFIDEPIKNLLNKIIIVNSTNINTNLEDILDDNTYQINNNNNNTIIANNNNMQRIYSKAIVYLQFSYNYDPVIHWKNKANFVSFNFQTFDDALIKNYTMFKDYSLVHFSEISFD